MKCYIIALCLWFQINQEISFTLYLKKQQFSIWPEVTSDRRLSPRFSQRGRRIVYFVAFECEMSFMFWCRGAAFCPSNIYKPNECQLTFTIQQQQKEKDEADPAIINNTKLAKVAVNVKHGKSVKLSHCAKFRKSKVAPFKSTYGTRTILHIHAPRFFFLNKSDIWYVPEVMASAQSTETHKAKLFIVIYLLSFSPAQL